MAVWIFCKFFVPSNMRTVIRSFYTVSSIHEIPVSSGVGCSTLFILKLLFRLLFCFEYLLWVTCSCICFNDRLGHAAFKLAQVPQGTSMMAFLSNRRVVRNVLTDRIPLRAGEGGTGGRSQLSVGPLFAAVRKPSCGIRVWVCISCPACCCTRFSPVGSAVGLQSFPGFHLTSPLDSSALPGSLPLLRIYNFFLITSNLQASASTRYSIYKQYN